eukprot:UN15046
MEVLYLIFPVKLHFEKIYSQKYIFLNVLCRKSCKNDKITIFRLQKEVKISKITYHFLKTLDVHYINMEFLPLFFTSTHLERIYSQKCIFL